MPVIPLGDDVAVPAMGARDVVVVAQGGAGADAHRFLADLGVQEARQLAGLEQLDRALLQVPAMLTLTMLEIHDRNVHEGDALHELGEMRQSPAAQT